MDKQRVFKFGSDPKPGGTRNIDDNKLVFGGALAALSPNMPSLLPALLAPQVMLGMFFNVWLLVYYLSDKLTIGDVAVFYFFELGLHLCLYTPMAAFHILADQGTSSDIKKERLKELGKWVAFGVFFSVVFFQSYTQSMTGYHEQLLLVMTKLKLGLLPFALQFCLGTFYFLTRKTDRYSYQAAFFPLCWYIAGQFSVFPFIFFIAVPGWFLTDSFKPGVAVFLLLRINNEVGPQLAAMKLGEDLDWNNAQRLRWEMEKAAGDF